MKQGKNQLHDNFSTRLRARMLALKIGQVSLAKEVGVAQSAVSGWLNGAFPGSVELHRLSKVLGVEMGWFFEVIPYSPAAISTAKTKPPKDVPASAIPPQHRAGTALAMKISDYPELRGDLLKMLESEIERRRDLTDKETFGRLPDVKAQLPVLRNRLIQATQESGRMSELANYLSEATGEKVPLASVSRWLSGNREPGGEITLQLLHWVERQERQK